MEKTKVTLHLIFQCNRRKTSAVVTVAFANNEKMKYVESLLSHREKLNWQILHKRFSGRLILGKFHKVPLVS